MQYYYDNEEVPTNSVALTNEFSLNYFNLFLPGRRLGHTKDRLFTFDNVFYFHKPSMLKDPFNEELYKYHEAGLIRYWIKQYSDTRNIKEERMASKLEIGNISGAFQICALMYFISFVVSILEVISGRCPRVRYVLEYFTY